MPKAKVFSGTRCLVRIPRQRRLVQIVPEDAQSVEGLISIQVKCPTYLSSCSVISVVREPTMGNVRIPPLHPRLAITMLIVLLAAGCQGRLAQQDEYLPLSAGWSPQPRPRPSTSSRTMRLCMPFGAPARATHRPAYPKTRLLFTVPCLEVPPSGKHGSDHASPRRERVLPTAAQSNAYIRWVQDRVRPLPDPSETASSIAGGS